MREYKCLAHTRWGFNYHVVFILNKKQKLIYENLRKFLGEIFHDLVARKR
mgnify:CR=1 FL=1